MKINYKNEKDKIARIKILISQNLTTIYKDGEVFKSLNKYNNHY